MPTYKLIYFDAMGRAELARCMFAESGVKYEDKRVSVEEWPSYKSKTPFGQLPILEIDGTPLCQSGAINRFLARELKLCGENSLQNAYVDMISESLSEVVGKLPFMEKDAAKKEERKAELLPKIDDVLGKFEKKYVERKKEFLVGESVSYADIMLMLAAGAIENFYPNQMAKYPGLKKLRDNVAARPCIKKWIADRPKTDF